MKPVFNQYMQVNNYNIRTETHQGEPHLIIPVIMMVEGVHNGSAGAILHTVEELSKFPAAWNGIPVVIGHPTNEGQPISANSPGVIDKNTVGRVYHTRMDGIKLHGEVWASVQKLKQISPLAYAYIMQQKPLDVSVGVFSEDEPTPGQWGTENYTAIAKNYRPDHLALLPDEQGACSWLDGCGIRTNAEGLVEAVSLVRDKLYAMDTEQIQYYLEEVYDDGTFIYKKENNGDCKYFKQGYQINNGEVQFDNEIVEVVKEVKYRKIITNQGGTPMDKVKELLTMTSLYTEDDKPWLKTMEDAQIDKLLTCAKAGIEASEMLKSTDAEKITANEKITTLEAEIAELKKGTPQIDENAALQALKEKVSDMKTFATLLPEELKGQFEYGQKLYDNHRKEVIAHIVTNQAQKSWTEEDLNSQDTATLQKIADSIKAPVSYEANGVTPTINTSDEMLLPPGVQV
jgi:hypothetical protein